MMVPLARQENGLKSSQVGRTRPHECFCCNQDLALIAGHSYLTSAKLFSGCGESDYE
jgi:hypothetical protein